MTREQAQDFAELLRRARRAVGLTQEELAEQAGLSARAISALERGVNRSPRRDTLDMLADALELSSDERRQWEQVRRNGAIRVTPEPDALAGRRSSAALSSLPAQATRFFGRQDEISMLLRFLQEDQTDLVTLTGPGGSGKTRLAIRVAATLVPDHRDGVYFIDLAPVNDPEDALASIANALGIHPRIDQPVRDALADWLAEKCVLLVLDNLEQIPALAPDIAWLLERAANLRIIATSRAPLRLRAEREFPVPPLPLPPDDRDDPETVAAYEVVRLFTDRARAVDPNFGIDGGEPLVVARICRHLDGLPLGIELAAACVRLFPPRTILARLEQRLPLLDAGPRDAPARQRTLHDTIAWSYELLAPSEQALLRRLSVFKGGWTLEAAEAVGQHEEPGNSSAILQGLAKLVEHNLVQAREGHDGTPRFAMLETIREFGLARLDESDELASTRARHARYFTSLFEGSERDWHSQRASAWLQRGDAELENLRGALTWTIENDAELALRLARQTAWIRSMRGAYREALGHLQRALANAGDATGELRAGALWWIGAFASNLGDYALARTALEESLAIRQAQENFAGQARCLHGLGRIAMFADNPDEAVSLYDAAIELFNQDYDPSLMVTLLNLGLVLLSLGRLERAATVLDQALQLAERDGLDWHRAQIHDARGVLALERKDLPGAREALRHALQLHWGTRDLRFVAESLETCAWLAIAEGSPAQAARILGAVKSMREEIAVPVPPSIQRSYDRHIPDAEESIGPADWKCAWDEGRALSPAEALRLALHGLT